MPFAAAAIGIELLQMPMHTSVSSLYRPVLNRRVVVTGIGLVSPFASNAERTWQAILSGQRSVRRWNADNLGFAEQSAARWLGAPAVNVLGTDTHCFEPVIAMAVHAATQAAEDSNVSLSPDAHRVGCVIGASKVGLRSFGHAMHALRSDAILDATFDELVMPDGALRAVAQKFNVLGPTLCPVAACATGLICILRGADLIRSSECDVVFAGSSDASLVPIVLGSFQRLGVLARTNDVPASACRPFDANRSGFVIGEGAAVFVLESLDAAIARQAKIYAELVVGGLACDPSGITQLDANGESLTWLIGDVLRRSGLSPSEVDYINLHGTATRANDLAESRAIRAAFGAAADRVLCSSQKGAIGHLLGAAGSVETAMTLLAMRDGIAPPTVNLATPDPACGLDYVANESRPAAIQHALKLSLGFGGHLAAALFRRL